MVVGLFRLVNSLVCFRSGWSETRDASKPTWKSSWGSWRSPWRRWLLAHESFIQNSAGKWSNDVECIYICSMCKFSLPRLPGKMRTTMLVGKPRKTVSPNNAAAAAHDSENDGNGLSSPRITGKPATLLSSDDDATGASFEAGITNRVRLGS